MNSLNVIPKLADVLADSGKVASLSPEAIPAMLGELEQLKAMLWYRLNFAQGNAGYRPNECGERLLDVREAAAMLHTSADYLYRHSSKLPFTVHMGRQLRFSESGVKRYIQQRTGR